MRKRGVFLLILAMGTLAGCSADMTEKNLNHLHFVKASEEMGDKTSAERAYTIKQRLGQMEELSGSAVVVEGHTAIIGLRFRESMEQNALTAVKKEADRAAKEADEYIKSTSITMNPYIVALIEDMEKQRAG